MQQIKIKINKIGAAMAAALALWARDASAPDAQASIGGQAVIEGVLMKGPRLWGLAVRQPNGQIFKESWNSSSKTKNYPWKLPVLRGVVTMIEMVGTGFRALGKSAEIALGDSEEELTKKDLCVAIFVGATAVIGLFIVLPLWLSEAAASFFSLSSGARNAAEGGIRGGIFIAYVAVIGLWRDTQQVFRYHGAEHKTINAFEALGSADILTRQVIAAYSRIHPRCGTSFLLIAIFVGIAVFSVAGGGGVLWRAGLRIALLPLVIGVSYEMVRLASKSGFAGKLFMAPMLSLQYLTTREPDLEQIGVALASFNAALGRKD